MKSIIKKLGKTSITVEKDYHSSNKEYNKLTVVEEQGAFKTYLSRKPVPVGIELTNREYWIPFSGVLESIVFDYLKFKKDYASGKNLEDNAIITRHICDRNVTGNKIADDAITTEKIVDDSIIISKLSTDIQFLISNLSKTSTFAGIATPTTNPGTPDGSVFYFANSAGIYTNFNNIKVLKGENIILKWNNNIWTKNVFKPNTDFDSIFDVNGKSLTEFESGIVYDVSAHNNNAVFKSLQDLLSSSNLSTLIPMSVRHGGMSIRFIQSSDNKYVQWRLVSKYWNTDVNNWVAENEDFRNNVMQEVNTAVASIKPIEITGNVTNASDEEDLTSVNVGGTDVLKFKDKPYTPLTYSGMGRKILRKNIVDSINTLTQSMMQDTNTIYVIQYDFDLRGATIEIPEKCVLEFNGGSLDNGVLLGNKTSIVAGSYKIFGDNLALFKYGYIKVQSGYIDHAMVPLEYIVENGTMNVNKVQPDTQLFSRYNYTEKLVTDGYERASNENDNGVITPIGEFLDVRTDLVISPKQKATFSNNAARVMFNSSSAMSLNGLQLINLHSSEGIFTVPVTTRYLFFDGNGTLLHPGNTHADNDVYCSYMSKLIPLVSQSTFVGKAKLSWFVGDAYAAYIEDINGVPDATLQFQKAMLSNFDIESDIEGYIRVEDSIYFETSKVVDFGGSYGWDSGIRQYNSIGNTKAHRNYSQKLIVYTLSTNKPLVYIRNSSIKLIGGKFTAEYSSNHASEICIFDTNYPISGARFDGTVFCGKTASDNSLSSTCGIKFLPRGLDNGSSGHCYNLKLDVSIYNCQYGISFAGPINSMDIDLWIDGYYKTLVGSIWTCNINMIAQARKCLPKSLADGLLCDVYILGGTVDGFFWDLGTESQTSDIITPYGKGKVSGSCQLIGKSTYQGFHQWITPNTLIDKYTMDVASIPRGRIAPWRNGCVSVSRFIRTNINTVASYAKVYKKTDGFQNSLQPTAAEAVRSHNIFTAIEIFSADAATGPLPQIDDDEYLEMVFYPSSTGYFLSNDIGVQHFTIFKDDIQNAQVIIDNRWETSSTTDNISDFSMSTGFTTKISYIIVRLWGKTGNWQPKIHIWNRDNKVNTANVGINEDYAVYNGGNFTKYIDGTNIGKAAIANLNIGSDVELTDKINSLNTLNSSPVLISKQSNGILWLYKNKALFNLDGTGATLVHAGPTTKRPEHTIDNKSLTKGTIYRDTDICKTIIWDGNKWVEEDGATPGVKRSGTFSDKPIATDIYVGFKYFCTDKQTVEGATNGIEIIHKGNDVWVDALGRVVS